MRGFFLYMDIFKLSRNFFDWSFENPELITPTHSAIYFFAIEHCNRLWWKEKFWFPTSMAMEAIGIRKWETYNKAYRNLVEWGFIKEIEKSKNQYSSCIISISNAYPKNGKALDKALVKHGKKHSVKQGESTGESTGVINIQETRNKKQETNISKDIQEQALEIIWKKEIYWNEEINDLLESIKNEVNFLWFIYKKWKYERERAKNILTSKEFWEICKMAKMSRIEFCKNIIHTSALLTFWNWKINNAETLYTNYAKVYNEAVNKKKEIENTRPRSIVV